MLFQFLSGVTGMRSTPTNLCLRLCVLLFALGISGSLTGQTNPGSARQWEVVELMIGICFLAAQPQRWGFFTDYLAGDVYFKTTYQGQNLNRGRVQIKLCESIETRESMLRRVLESV